MNNIHLGVVMTIYGFLIRWLIERHSFGEYTGLVILCSLGLLLLGAVGRWFLFRKAGRNPWYACVPFLCRYTLFDLSWHGWIAGVVILLELINIRMSPAIGQPLEAGVRSTVYFLSFLGAFILTFIMKLKLVKSFDLPLITVLGSAFMEHLFNLIIALQPTEYQGRTLQEYNSPEPEHQNRYKGKKRTYIINLTRRHSRIAFLASTVVAVCTFGAVVEGLLVNPEDLALKQGESLFMLFTVNSNLLSGLGAAFLIPYALEGIRNKRFVFPKWIAMFQYSGAICTTLTMLFASTFIAGTMGWRLAFTGMNFWLHVLCPIMALVLLFSAESRTRFSISDSLIALIPFYLYAGQYIVRVVLIGEANGGWRDIYLLTKFIPAALSAPLMFMLSYFIAMGIRLLYNRINEQRTREIASVWKPEMDKIEVSIEIYGLGRYIGISNPHSQISLPLELFHDIQQVIPISTDDLARVYTKGVTDGLKETRTRKSRFSYRINRLVGTPEKQASAEVLALAHEA